MSTPMSPCAKCHRNLTKTAHVALAVAGLGLAIFGALIWISCSGPIPTEGVPQTGKLGASPMGVFFLATGVYFIVAGSSTFGTRAECCRNKVCLCMAVAIEIGFVVLQFIFVVAEVVIVYAFNQTPKETHCDMDGLAPDVAHVAIGFFGLILAQITLIVMNRGQAKLLRLSGDRMTNKALLQAEVAEMDAKVGDAKVD